MYALRNREHGIFFLQHGGRITCEVTGHRKLSSVPNKGLVVPCLYTFWGKPKIIKRLVKLMWNKYIANRTTV